MEEQLTDVRRSSAVFRGMENGRELEGSVNGKACCYMFDPDHPGSGEGVEIRGTILPGARMSLISVSEMCEKQGFTQVIQPSYQGESGFYKEMANGKIVRLPITLDKRKGLYVAYYGG